MTLWRLALILLVLCGAQPAAAQGAYAGKVVTILIPSNPGGGIDAYSRLLARHIGKHIPGQPNVTVQNVPGAGGLRALNMLVGKSAHDGTVILNVNSGNLIHELMGEPAACRHVLNMWDDAPRDVARRELLAEVTREIERRAGVVA